jgi:ABC-type spermidine/putrescine transport system permease subunit I
VLIRPRVGPEPELRPWAASTLNGMPRSLLALPSWVLWVLLFVLPAGILVIYSFGTTNPLTLQVAFGWTVDAYRRVLDPLYLGAILRSLSVAVITVAVCLLIGFPAAMFMARQSGRIQRLLLIAVIVPFWTSFVVRCYAWIDLLRNGGPVEDVLRALGLVNGSLDVLYTQTSIAIVMVYAYLPLMILPLFVTLERLDLRLDEAAADLGANRWRTLRRVIFPLAKPGIVAGCVLVGVPAIGEYTVPQLLGGGKTLMFGNVIAQQFQTVGDYSFGAALATSLTAAVVLLLIVFRPRSGEKST